MSVIEKGELKWGKRINEISLAFPPLHLEIENLKFNNYAKEKWHLFHRGQFRIFPRAETAAAIIPAKNWNKAILSRSFFKFFIDLPPF